MNEWAIEAEQARLKEEMKREENLQKYPFYKYLYWLDDKALQFAEWVVKDKVNKVVLLICLFSFLDSFTTHILIDFGLGYEANPIPAKLFSAGLIWEYEIIKFFLLAMTIGFYYAFATRGFTLKERKGGKLGLALMYFLFVFVVTNNIVQAIWSLLGK